MIGRSLSQRFLVLGTVFAGSGVAAGAFGAHALKGILDAPDFKYSIPQPGIKCIMPLDFV